MKHSCFLLLLAFFVRGLLTASGDDKGMHGNGGFPAYWNGSSCGRRPVVPNETECQISNAAFRRSINSHVFCDSQDTTE
jgi:hypothetical protein